MPKYKNLQLNDKVWSMWRGPDDKKYRRQIWGKKVKVPGSKREYAVTIDLYYYRLGLEVLDVRTGLVVIAGEPEKTMAQLIELAAEKIKEHGGDAGIEKLVTDHGKALVLNLPLLPEADRQYGVSPWMEPYLVKEE